MVIIFSLAGIILQEMMDLKTHFVYQPGFDTLELKKGTDYFLSWKSKRVFNSKLKPLYTTFLNSIRLSGYRILIKFDKHALSVDQNNYLTKIVNIYIVYDLDAWQKNRLRNFTLKNCLFGATNTIKNSDKEKYWYSCCGLTFDGKGEWSFGNDFARNVLIFGVDNSSSSYSENRKNNFLILCEDPTLRINWRFESSEKTFE